MRLKSDDALTLIALGILAFALANFSHEALGHGLAALAVGGKPLLLTTCYFQAAGRTSGWIPAGGGIANVTVGSLSFLSLRTLRPRSPHLLYFLVLAVAFNLFFAAGYPAYSGVAAFGDWAAVISPLTPQWLWRGLLVCISIVSYYLSLELVAWIIRPFGSSRQAEALARLRRVTLVPYLAALATAALAGALNPGGWTVIFTSALPAAAAAFGLTQMDHFHLATSPDAIVPAAGPITRSPGWIAAAAVVLAFFVAVLGPGIRFSVR
jgi:hypothetical protein